MKRWWKIMILLIFIFTMLACSEEEIGSMNMLSSSSCTMTCGELMTCDGGKGELKKGESTIVQYSLANRYKTGNPDYTDQYEAGLKQLNITITLTVDEGTAKASFKAPDGTVTSVEASKDSPGVVTGVAALKVKKVNPNSGNNKTIESIEIEITVESIDGPVTGAQVDFVINDCFDSYCKKTEPACNE